MTIAELDRALESKKRVIQEEQKHQAVFTYILADLIGYSVGRIHNKDNKFPSIEEVFPQLFDGQEKAEELEQKKIERFAAQLKQFSNSHNNKLKGVKQI